MEDAELLAEIRCRAMRAVNDNIELPTRLDYVYAESLMLIGALMAMEHEARPKFLPSTGKEV